MLIRLITVMCLIALSAIVWISPPILRLAPWNDSGRAGRVLPQFEAVRLDGHPAGFGDFTDQVVLLNVWATWCPPCRGELPSLQRLYEEYNDDGLNVVAVSVDRFIAPEDVGGALGRIADEYSITFTILHEPSGTLQSKLQVWGVPQSFLLSNDGTILKRITGAKDWDDAEYRRMIEQLLE